MLGIKDIKLGFKTILFVLVATIGPGVAIAQGTCETNPRIATDSAHSAIVARDCTVWMWGFNNAGQFASKPKSYTEPEKFQRLQRIPPLLDIVVAHDHTLGISQDHDALIWGSEEYLSCGGDFFPFNITPKRVQGLPKVESIIAMKHINLYLTKDGIVFEQGCTNNITGTIKKLPTQVSGLPKVVSIAVGSSHRLSLTKDGEVWSWGDWNHFGQLGTGDKDPRIKPVKVEGLPTIVAISAGSWHSMALDTDGNIWVWGSNENWQLGIIGSGYLSPVQIRGIPKVRAIATGWFSSAAVTRQNRVLAWGDRIYPTPAEIPNLHDVLSVYVGGNAAATAGIFTIQMDGSVYRWQPEPRIQKNDQAPFRNGILSRFPSDSSAPFKLEMPNKKNQPIANAPADFFVNSQ